MEALVHVVEGMTREVYLRLRTSLEHGRWPDGRRMSAAQREHTMQLVIAWEARNLPPGERSGQVDGVCAGRDRDAAGGSAIIARDSGEEPA